MTTHNQRQTRPAFLSRRNLVRAAGAAALATVPAPAARVDARQGPDATPGVSGQAAALPLYGVSYDVGTDYTPAQGVLSLQTWDAGRAREEMRVIRDDLHSTGIMVFGTDLDRLENAAEIAADLGLTVWLQPRVIDATEADLTSHLVEAATRAEAIRSQGADITLNIGVEFSIFADGVIPGETFTERLGTLVETFEELPTYNERLNDLLDRLVAVAREPFGGPISYGAGPWEAPDWGLFDVVGVDLYRDAYNRDTYDEQLTALQAHGKPVVITEFGCCCYEGAAEVGGAGFQIVDWSQTPPVLDGDYVRSEQEQADYLDDLLSRYVAAGVHGAFVFTFLEAAYPYSPDPHYDLDMASFGIVKVWPDSTDQGYDATGYWEPKAGFRLVAERFAALSGGEQAR
ncbi:MAG: hypothetical protein KC442_03725 [Thermomicrobiales bacterium]|nr:hypothetical protein [Thermomicrobiales bacterium]